MAVDKTSIKRKSVVIVAFLFASNLYGGEAISAGSQSELGASLIAFAILYPLLYFAISRIWFKVAAYRATD